MDVNFKKWLLETDSSIMPEAPRIYTINDCVKIWKDAIEEFNVQLSAASLIDGRVGMVTRAFLYLESRDEIYIGDDGSHHMSIVKEAGREDMSLYQDLTMLFFSVSGGSIRGPNGVVGRVALGIDWEMMKRYLPERLREKYEGENERELAKKFRDLNVIMLYKSTGKTEKSVKMCLKKIIEKGVVEDVSNTIVVNEGRVTLLSSPEHQISPQELEEPVKKEIPSGIKGKIRAKPETWRQAGYMAGIPIGESKKYR